MKQMKYSSKIIYSLCIGSMLFFFGSCKKEPGASDKGIIFVSVVDNDAGKTPVPNVEIKIMPVEVTGKTNDAGTASFEIDPGDYYVDADVCCIGPGFIQYHEPVTVHAEDTAKVELTACLRCL